MHPGEMYRVILPSDCHGSTTQALLWIKWAKFNNLSMTPWAHNDKLSDFLQKSRGVAAAGISMKGRWWKLAAPHFPRLTSITIDLASITPQPRAYFGLACTPLALHNCSFILLKQLPHGFFPNKTGKSSVFTTFKPHLLNHFTSTFSSYFLITKYK